MAQYYVDISGTKDGPHDLVTVMRRIRAQKIGPDTGIFVDDAETAVPACQLADTAMFFSKAQVNEQATEKKVIIPSLRLYALLREGWRFTSENSIMTVFAGGMLLLTILVASGLVTAMGAVLGGMLSWLVFLMFHFIYLVACLRMYRNQRFTAKFWNEQLSPVLALLLFAAIVIGLMMVGGFMLLIIPGLVVSVYYAFVPFFILDRQMTLIEAMHASRLLVQKHRGRFQVNVAMLIILHAVCLALIMPIPVSLPVFAAALSRFYEELSSS